MPSACSIFRGMPRQLWTAAVLASALLVGSAFATQQLSCATADESWLVGGELWSYIGAVNAGALLPTAWLAWRFLVLASTLCLLARYPLSAAAAAAGYLTVSCPSAAWYISSVGYAVYGERSIDRSIDCVLAPWLFAQVRLEPLACAVHPVRVG